jgi:hypothetical protein
MSWYYIYSVSDGRLISETDTLPTGLVASLSFITLANRADKNVMWDESTRAFIARPAKVLMDRLQDLLDDAGFADAYNSLSVARRNAIRNRAITILGTRRFRTSNDTPGISD